MGAVSGRSGVTMVETLVALLLLFLVVELTWSVVARWRRAAAVLEQRAGTLAAERAAWWVLREELAAVEPARDRSSVAGDSVSLRAFRGAAVVCPGDGGEARVRVRYRGLRLAEADKDSVLVLAGDGWHAVGLVSVEGPATCEGSPGDGWSRWRLERAVPGAALVRLYERGSYHLADRAFRYRIGAGGRQPLTPEALGRGSGLVARGRGVEVRLLHRRGPLSGTPDTVVRTLRPWGGG